MVTPISFEAGTSHKNLHLYYYTDFTGIYLGERNLQQSVVFVITVW